MKQNPWLGLSSYDEEAISKGYKFCGREQAVNELYSIIDNNICTILYGKSGIGKSSLLKAGIFPRLRADNYLPVFIRLGAINKNDHDYVDIVKREILNALNQINGRRIQECRYEDDHIDSFLWNFFQNSDFRNNQGDTIFPVVVLDQFEELYFKDKQKLNILLRSLYRLLDDSSISISPNVKSPNYRLVITIREDDMFHLEDSIDKLRLVEMKGNRYRLRELNDQEAREVILQPCSDLFYPKEEEVDKIVNRIVEESKAGKTEISTAILSLICSKIYDTYTAPNMLGPNGEVAQIIYPEVKLFFEQAEGNFLKSFYDDVIKELDSPSRWYYIEDHLVTDEGRRNSVLKSEFEKMVPDSAFLFKGDKSILRYVSATREDEPRVELIHDILAHQMKSSRNERKLRQEAARLRKRNAVAIFAVAVMFGLGFIYLAQYRSILSERNGMLKMQAHYIAELADSYVDQGITILPARLLIKVLPRLNHEYAAIDGSIRKVDFNISNVEALFFHDRDVRTVAFGSSDDVVLTSSLDSTAKLWNILTGEQEGSTMFHSAALMSAEFSPNEKYVLTSSLDSTARLWTRGGEPVGNIMTHDGGVCSAVFNSEGDYIVTASKDSTSKLWNSRGEYQGVTMRHSGSVNRSIFNPKGNRILTVSADSTARLWDLDGRPVGQIMRHDGNVSYAVFDPNGERLLTASVDSTARLWNNFGEQIAAPMIHEGGVNMALFSPKGNYILTASSDSTAKLWDANGNFLAIMKHNGCVSSVDFSADEEYIVTASWDKTIKIWNNKGEQVGETMIHDSQINDVSFSPSGQYVAAVLNDNIVQVWNINDIKYFSHSAEINSIEFSHDGRCLIIAYRDSTAILWDLNTRARKGAIMKHDGIVNSASFNNNGSRVVTASSDGIARLWDLEGNELTHLMKHNASVCSASFSPDGSYIVTASKDSTVKIWNLNGEQLGKTIKYPASVNFAMFSPIEDHVIIACDDKTVKRQNFYGEKVASDLEHEDAVCAVSYKRDIRDGDYILTASADETVKLWNVRDGLICEFPHDSGVKSAIFSPHGNYIVTITNENDVWLWNMEGKRITEIKAMEEEIVSVAFSPAGDVIALASNQGKVIIKEFHTLSELTDKYKKLLHSCQLSEGELIEYHFK